MTGAEDLAGALSLARAVGAGLLVAAAAWTDLRTGRIPNALTASGLGLGLVLAGAVSIPSLGMALLGAGLAAASLAAVRGLGFVLVRQPGMGWGDIKLAAALGACMGPLALWALYLAAVAGAIVGLGLRARDRRRGAPAEVRRMVFAPFIALGWALSLGVPVPFLDVVARTSGAV